MRHGGAVVHATRLASARLPQVPCAGTQQQQTWRAGVSHCSVHPCGRPPAAALTLRASTQLQQLADQLHCLIAIPLLRVCLIRLRLFLKQFRLRFLLWNGFSSGAGAVLENIWGLFGRAPAPSKTARLRLLWWSGFSGEARAILENVW